MIKLSSEQEMLRDGAERYLRDRYGFAERTKILESVNGYDDARWRDFAEMGWLGLAFPEDYGGSGGTMVDVLLLMKAFGRSLVVEPFLASVVLGGLTILAAGNSQQKQKILPQIAAGQLKMAFGFAEAGSGYEPYDVGTRAERSGNGFRLNGRKAVVFGAPSADFIIVSARSSGGQRDKDGLSLFLLDQSTPGLSLRSYQTIDGRRAAEVFLKDVQVGDDQLIGQAGSAAPIIEEALMAGRVAVLGEAVGALDGAVEQTIEYLNIREQFGKKLATYQALRHRVADMYVLTREAHALAGLAAQSLVNGDADRFATVCGAKAYICEEGRSVAENAVQLHGAIAIADEYVVGHYLKRIIAIDRMFGDVEHNLDVFTKGTRAFA